MTPEEALVLVEHVVYHSPHTKRSLNSLQRTIFQYAWEERSYAEMARQLGYELSYVKQTGSQLWRLLSQVLEEKVTEHSLRLVLQRNLQPLESERLDEAAVTSVDWGDAVDVNCFYGREAELSQLMQWVLVDRCRLIGIFGMGGMGKTSLAIRLAQQLNQQGHFSRVVWRSLRDAPLLSDLIEDLLQVLSPSPTTATAHRPIGKTLPDLIYCFTASASIVVSCC